ncbi:zinc finger CCCH domain-containing protein 65 isoform X1 [Jatropha curcas]|uniref:zinc finger CCCH domain-containing protein 65 isoform X1 n=1 Tax=Jatropha curcas TaxID=180498 RepID=UPI0005FC0946|nr:zinc finger CCCH domain-containing protein 65 isoform X1 [Jatropha curcas]
MQMRGQSFQVLEMEKPHIETPKSPFAFSSHRKSHLKSETYHTLVRILSQCYKHPELCEPAPPPQQLRTVLVADDQSNEQGGASEKVVCENIELATPSEMDHNNSSTRNSLSVNDKFDSVGLHDNTFSDTQLVISEIENIMRIEEGDHRSKQNDGTNETDLQDQGFGELQHFLMDELEHLMKGDEEVSSDKNCNFTMTSLGGNLNQSHSEAVALSNDREHLDLQAIVMEECEVTGQQQVDKGCSSRKILEIIDSSLDTSVASAVSKLTDNSDDRTSVLTTNELEANHEMQKKDMESGKPVCTSITVGSPNHVIEDAEVEEGQVSGEFEVNGKLIDVFSEDIAASQEQKKQLAEEVRNEMVHKRKVVVYEDPIFAEESHGFKKQKKGSETKETKKGSRTKGKKKGNTGSNNLGLSAKKSDQNTTLSQGIIRKEKLPQDAGLCNKQKRGTPSEQKKVKKKEAKRKKRAQKNRELGVKRLKLRPVEKPKTVIYCRHYINGRCYEGEKCKFSHDTIPVTKSMPCSHFVHRMCLKGDDCPFDHELSKYPCTNYVTTGSCSRGEGCMFSHKLPLKDDLPSNSNACTPELKPASLMSISNCKKQLDSGGTSHNTIKASPDSVGNISRKNPEQNLAKSVPSAPVPVPKGIRFFSAGKSCVTKSNPSALGGSAVTRNEGFKAGCQTDQNASGTVQISNEIPRGTPAVVTPKGINFLSFGKPPSGFSSTRKLTSNTGAKLSLPNNFSVIKRSISHINLGNSIQASNETSQSVSNTSPWLNKMLQTEFAMETQKSKILSFGESSTDGPKSTTQGSLPSSSATCVGRSAQASEIAPNKCENSSAISQERSISPLGLGHSADYSAPACLKNTPNSVQKALISTLAFAAKVESGMKMKQSTNGAIAVDSGVGKETAMAKGPQNNSAKA